jgi:hypothetical protein
LKNKNKATIKAATELIMMTIKFDKGCWLITASRFRGFGDALIVVEEGASVGLYNSSCEGVWLLKHETSALMRFSEFKDVGFPSSILR